MKNDAKKLVQAVLLLLSVPCGGLVLHSFALGHPGQAGRGTSAGTASGFGGAPDASLSVASSQPLGVMEAARTRLDIARQEMTALSTASSGSPKDRTETRETADRLDQLSGYVLRRSQPPLRPSDQAEVTRIGGLIHQMAASARRPKLCMDNARIALALEN